MSTRILGRTDTKTSTHARTYARRTCASIYTRNLNHSWFELLHRETGRLFHDAELLTVALLTSAYSHMGRRTLERTSSGSASRIPSTLPSSNSNKWESSCRPLFAFTVASLIRINKSMISISDLPWHHAVTSAVHTWSRYL